MKKILIIEDARNIRMALEDDFRFEGYQVESAATGPEGLEKALDLDLDIIILDLMLPELNGLEICKELRRRNIGTPIIMLTAKGEEVDRVLGLEMGADDYMTKPFSPRELIARVKAVLRRSVEKPFTEKILKVGELEIDRERYTVSLKGEPVKLSATEFRLLLFLAERKGKVFSRDQLLDAVWRDEAFVEPRTVDVHVRRLRSQIEDDPAHPRYVKTMRGIGYSFSDK